MIIYNSAVQEGGGHKTERRPKPPQKDIRPASTGQTSVAGVTVRVSPLCSGKYTLSTHRDVLNRIWLSWLLSKS